MTKVTRFIEEILPYTGEGKFIQDLRRSGIKLVGELTFIRDRRTGGIDVRGDAFEYQM